MKQEHILCNVCGRLLNTDGDILTEDALTITKEWGYFSKKDTMIHRFTVCEACYDKWIKEFAIAPEVSEQFEL